MRPISALRKTVLAAAVSTLFLAGPSSGTDAPGPLGGQFRVNTVDDADQINAAVAMDADGDFVVAWQSRAGGDFDIRAQRYNAAGGRVGPEIAVNALTANAQDRPAVAMDADGDFVVVWRHFFSDSDPDIRGRRFSAAGDPLGADFDIEASSDPEGNPAVAMSAGGAFVVTWDRRFGSGDSVRARRYDAGGAALGAVLSVSTGTTGNQRDPAVALDAAGNFVLAWESTASGGNIRARRYNLDGVALGEEFSANSATTAAEFQPVVAMDAGGDFVVAWADNGGGLRKIQARRYNAAGLAQGGQFAVSAATADTPRLPAIALDADGDFTVAWQTGPGNSGEIIARRYDGAGAPRGEEFRVNNVTTNTQLVPAVALDADGDFTVVWHGYDSSGYGIMARRFRSSELLDVGLVQSDSVDPAPVGAPLSYTLNASNLQAPQFPTGVDAIDAAIGGVSGLRVVDLVPAGSSAVSASGANWTCALPTPERVVCDYGLILLAGEEASPITVTLTPPNAAGTAISNVARATASQLDDDPLNNRGVERTRLVCAESVIQLTASSYTVSEAGPSAPPSPPPAAVACAAPPACRSTAPRARPWPVLISPMSPAP